MMRKSRKGVTGKAEPTSSARYNVGPGTDFKGRNLATGPQIDAAVKRDKEDMGLE